LDARLARGRRIVEGLNRFSARLAPRAPRTALLFRGASKRLQRTLRRRAARTKRRMAEEKLHNASEEGRRRERAAAIRSRYIE
ncbi:MAG TPA: hypothetical protein VGV10_02770, partial [Thermoleophilaceae bacterium]|nr:hypothetical protein [Thermoleophilaceae bacterium]